MKKRYSYFLLFMMFLSLFNSTLSIDVYNNEFFNEILITDDVDLSSYGFDNEVISLIPVYTPMRICGMVRNEGEPGGGPFWVRGSEGRLSPQIVESSQVDWKSRQQRSVWESSTHFNPVDLVCGLRDYQGKPFDLSAFVDPDTGFVSTKSQDGRELLALELPGLWNGAMAHWNTVFVEVPLATFSPVKTVLDLLREEHQSV